MDRARLFISLPIEPLAASQIMSTFRSLDLPWGAIKIAEAEMHLTLKFIGDYPVDKIPYVIELLDNIKGRQDFIELHFNKAEISTPKNPRALFLRCEANDILNDLHADIEQTLYDNELVSKDARQFTPHITLGRIKKVVDFEKLSAFQKMPVDFIVSATYFQLQESQLSKSGPTYYTLQTFNL